MPQKRRSSSSEEPALVARKRQSDSDTTPASSSKRRKSTLRDSSEATPGSQRTTRSSTKGTWEYGMKRTLEDEFREIVAANAKGTGVESNEIKEESQEIGTEVPRDEDTLMKDEYEVDDSSSEVSSPPEEELKIGISDDSKQASMKKTHVRFGSEDPVAPPTLNVATPDIGDEFSASVEAMDEDAESEDEAPEALTRATAESQAKAAVSDAARAVERQKAERKQKRKRHDARLKEQSKSSQSKSTASRREPTAQSSASGGFSILSSNRLPVAERPGQATADTSAIPDLLPDSLLARAGDVRAPTPDRIVVSKLQQRKKHIKFIDHGEQPAKDVQKGPVNVRVLEKQNPFLAPKPRRGNISKTLREYMLQGRSGNGKYRTYERLERKKFGGGFLTK